MIVLLIFVYYDFAVTVLLELYQYFMQNCSIFNKANLVPFMLEYNFQPFVITSFISIVLGDSTYYDDDDWRETH